MKSSVFNHVNALFNIYPHTDVEKYVETVNYVVYNPSFSTTLDKLVVNIIT